MRIHELDDLEREQAREYLLERLEDDLVKYDEQGRLFGTSGAGAQFLAAFLVDHGWAVPE